MAVVYILYSEKLQKHYIGSCKDFSLRLAEHLSAEGVNGSFTSKARDWQVKLVKKNLGYTQARKIELHIKSMKSKAYVSNLVEYPEMREKLRAKFADSGSSR